MNLVVEFTHGKDITKGWTKTKWEKKTKPQNKKEKRTLQLAMEYFSRASRNSNEIITKCRQWR